MPDEADDSLLWQMFGSYSTVLSAQVVVNTETGRCQGEAQVIMSDLPEALFVANQFHGLTMGDRALQVSVMLLDSCYM